MNYLQIFKSAVTALSSNIMRTALTMLGIIIGIASVILIISLAQGATSSITSSLSSLGSNILTIMPGQQSRGAVQGSSSNKTLTYEDAQAIKKQVAHVSAVSAGVSENAQVIANGQNTNVTIAGVQEAYQTMQSLTIDHGTFISQGDEDGLSRVAVLGPDVVTDLFGEGSDPTGESIQIGSKFFRVIGVTQTKGSSGMQNPDNEVYVPVTTAMSLLLGQDYVSTVQVSVDDEKKIDTVQEDIKQLLLSRHNISDEANIDFSIRNAQSTLQTVSSITGTLTLMLAGIASISLVVGGIGIMNIMLVTVTERTKEVGLLKAIGATQKDILTQFLIESVVLTITGGIIGIILGLGLAYIITRIMSIPYVVSMWSILIAVGVSCAVGVIFGLYPARRAAQLSPIDALRFE